MLKQAVNVFRIPELRNRILFTLGVVAIFRFGFYLPIPGTNPEYLAAAIDATTRGATGYLGFISAITGSSMQPFLFSLGIMPYISASIVIQLLTTVIPSLSKLAKEGDAGRKKINEYTRYLTVLLCLVQGAMIFGSNLGNWDSPDIGPVLYFITAVTSVTAGTLFLMWLGEQVDEFGIGNGASLIIMAGIIDRIPQVTVYIVNNVSFSLTPETGKVGIATIVMLGVIFVGIVMGVVLITQAQRRIPMQQARHVRGRRVYGSAQRQYLPMRLNAAGVIPVIFAGSLMMVPAYLFGGLRSMTNSPLVSRLASAMEPGANPLYMVIYIALIFVFCFFWTAIQFQPNEMANNLRDHGSFIPGMRPGRRTAEYLEKVMNRITYVGAAFLAAIAILPTIVMEVGQVPYAIAGFLGGTALLIMVGVALDLVQRIESHLIMRNYEGFLSGGRVRGRR